MTKPAAERAYAEGATGPTTIHQTMQRLQAAALERHGISGTSELARHLNESPQTVGNWFARGVSKAGALKAETRLGVMSRWILSGAGPRFSRTDGSSDAPDEIQLLLHRLSKLLLKIRPDARDAISVQFQALAHAPDSKMLIQQLHHALTAAIDEQA